jgi:hypothetical protein
MNLLTPPTDNLYKFMFVGGLVLISIAGVGYYRSIEDVSKAIVEYNLASDAAGRAYRETMYGRSEPKVEIATGIASNKMEAFDIGKVEADKQLAKFLDEESVAEENLLRLGKWLPPTVIKMRLLATQTLEMNR